MVRKGLLLRAKKQLWNPPDNLKWIPTVPHIVTWEAEIHPAWSIAL